MTIGDEAAWRSARMRRLATTSWTVIGVAGAALAIGYVLGAFTGVVVPLVVAAVLGALLHPIVDRLERARVPRPIGSALVLVGLVVVVIASVWLTVVGVLDQSDEIGREVTRAMDYLDEQLGEGWNTIGDPDSATGSLADAVPRLFGGLSSWFGSVFSSVASFIVGTAISVFFLYYVLRDWHSLVAWVGSHLGVAPSLGADLVADSNGAIRTYFGAITVSSLVTAVLIGLTAVVIDVPLAFTIALVTFVTSYVPYIGAIFSGAFAVLIALGAGGATEALIMLAAVLIVQNIVQTLMLTKVSSDALSIHPIVNLGSTIIGAAIAGLLGAMLSAPVVAILMMARARIVAHRGDAEPEPDSDAGAPELA